MDVGGTGFGLDGIDAAISTGRNAGGFINEVAREVIRVRNHLSSKPEAPGDDSIRAEFSDLLEKLLQAQLAYSQVLDILNELKTAQIEAKRKADESGRYRLTQTAAGHVMLTLKDPNDGREEPMHNLCYPCFEDGKKSVLQRWDDTTLHCPRCRKRVSLTIEPPDDSGEVTQRFC